MLVNNETNLTSIKDLKSKNQKKYINVIHHYMCRLMEDEKLAIE